MKNDVIGIVDFYNSPSLGEITQNRTLGSTSFLGRYAFVDFALSNFSNSEIPTVGLLVKDNLRSISKHLGSSSAWLRNTKINKQIVMYNEKAGSDPKANTDLSNIQQNDWILYDTSASYLIFQPAHIIANVDLRPILKEHIERREDITVVYTKIKDASKEFRHSNLFEVDKDGYISGGHKNHGEAKPALASMEIWIINRSTLADINRRYQLGKKNAGLKEMIEYLFHAGIYKIHAHEFKGSYVRCFDSYEHYIEYCFELLDKEPADRLFLDEWPHYTLTHDTPPALYGEDSDVKNSYIANGAIVEGSVYDSIISRDVRIGKGSVIKNCIIFSNVTIGDDCVIENAIIDKYSIVGRGYKLKGGKKKYTYIKQGAIL